MILEVVKKGRKIIGFVHTIRGVIHYSFGKPSQVSYISFECNTVLEGINKIKDLHYSNNN